MPIDLHHFDGVHPFLCPSSFTIGGADLRLRVQELTDPSLRDAVPMVLGARCAPPKSAFFLSGVASARQDAALCSLSPVIPNRDSSQV